SDNTSSRSNNGYSPTSSAINSISASFNDNAVVRCCPCEPNVCTSLPLIANVKSSRCGPISDTPRRNSCSFTSNNFNINRSKITESDSPSAQGTDGAYETTSDSPPSVMP